MIDNKKYIELTKLIEQIKGGMKNGRIKGIN